jgi:hypothetical protein
MRFEKREVSTGRDDDAVFGGKVKFEVEVPQYESISEFVSAAGGEDKALEFANGAVATGAVNGARAYTRNAPKDSPETEVIEKATATARGYTPTGGQRGPSKKEKLATFDALMQRIKRGEEVGDDELEALADKYGA